MNLPQSMTMKYITKLIQNLSINVLLSESCNIILTIFTESFKGAVVVEWLSSWLAEVRVRFPASPLEYQRFGYLLLPSRDMAEIPLKWCKSSTQPTNLLKSFKAVCSSTWKYMWKRDCQEKCDDQQKGDYRAEWRTSRRHRTHLS